LDLIFLYKCLKNLQAKTTQKYSQRLQYCKRKDDLQRRILFITKSRWDFKTRFKWYEFIWSYL